jgi:replication initiation and membrane attachment protein DnaB
MSTDNNIRVINKAYERALKDPGEIIMSDDLLELMGGHADDYTNITADSHEIFVSNSDDPLDITKISGGLHTLTSQTKEDLAISFEIASITQEMLQKLHSAMHLDKKVNLTLKGDCGFSSENSTLKDWQLMKIAPRHYLLNITFRSDNVVF